MKSCIIARTCTRIVLSRLVSSDTSYLVTDSDWLTTFTARLWLGTGGDGGGEGDRTAGKRGADTERRLHPTITYPAAQALNHNGQYTTAMLHLASNYDCNSLQSSVKWAGETPIIGATWQIIINVAEK